MSGGDSEESEASRVFRVQSVRGELDARATQITPSLDNINSHDVFIIYSGTGLIIWNGANSDGEEAKEAVRLAQQLYPDLTAAVVQQGEEPEEFWTILGAEPGSEIGDTDGVNAPILSPRLFHVTARRAWEIFNFRRSVTLLSLTQ